MTVVPMNPLPVEDLVGMLNQCPTATDVAEFLRSEEITGTPHSAYCCPVSSWVSRESGKRVSTATYVTVWAGGMPGDDYLLSEAVGVFVRNFDLGDYPDLVSR